MACICLVKELIGNCNKGLRLFLIIILYVDSSFVNILLHYGVILLVVIWYSFYQLNKRGHFNTVEMLVFIVLILHSMFDPQFFELMYNPLLLLMGISWSKYRYNYQDV